MNVEHVKHAKLDYLINIYAREKTFFEKMIEVSFFMLNFAPKYTIQFYFR